MMSMTEKSKNIFMSFANISAMVKQLATKLQTGASRKKVISGMGQDYCFFLSLA